MEKEYGALKALRLTVHCTTASIFTLSVLLTIYNVIMNQSLLGAYIVVVIIACLFGLLCEALFKKSSYVTLAWILIIFYAFIALTTLFLWGINAPVGILTVGFTIILSGILVSYRAIPWVAFVMAASLCTIHLIHSANLYVPDTSQLSHRSHILDVLIYVTVFFIFALISWLSGSQRYQNLKRALGAEERLTHQKELLIKELSEESAALRNAELKQMRQLYKFAILGQSAAATLHDLSNRISILNLDIHDISQYTSNSKAIKNAQNSIDRINKSVREVKQQIDTYDHRVNFSPEAIIKQNFNDITKRTGKKTRYKKIVTGTPNKINGSPIALSQIFAILLNNSLDALAATTNPMITIAFKYTYENTFISIQDNGNGIPEDAKNSLFKPKKSGKNNGMGVGLYIASQLTEAQFKGKLTLEPSKVGAHFMIKIPNTELRT